MQGSTSDSLLISDLSRRYREGLASPSEVINRLLESADAADPHNVWITRLSREQVMHYVNALEGRSIDALPLYGIPFVIKDNIDLAGVPTTAGCPDFAYTPQRSATVVQRLLDAGAIPLGKANLDQFATGLVGARSPYGPCRNAVNPKFISGGSSGGSAVAVALGLASFSLGTDTAGSGRVPAAFNNIVGLKPSVGRLSTAGVVPACRSIDCVSIFALTTADAAAVLNIAEGFDAADPYSRPTRNRPISGLRFGVPRAEQLKFFGDADYEKTFADTVGCLEALGGSRIEIDFAPFADAARLLYEGPWVAERYAAVGEFIEAHPTSVLPVTRSIIEGGRNPTAVAAFQGQYRLKALKRASESIWSSVDLILTPTAGTIYSLAAIEADPIRLNSNLGYYTNFMNLFDLAGVAVPAGFRADGMPFGVTLVGPDGADHALLALGEKLHRARMSTFGASGLALPSTQAPSAQAAPTPLLNGYVPLAVCGAHMSALPLNHQLRDRGGYFLRAARTAPCYRLFALPGGPPFRPGLIRVGAGGTSIEIELWALPAEQLGSFVSGIPAPLGIGTLEFEQGAPALGFLCEAYATEGATDITAYGGWRAYIAKSLKS